MSKKFFIFMLVVAVGLLAFSSTALAAHKGYDYLKIVKLYIGETDAEVNFAPAKMDQAAYVKNGRTLVPFRFLGESLGAQITWDAASKQAVLKLADTEVKVTIGSSVAYVDGEMTKLDVPAETKGGRTFIPLRFVSESLGAGVDYEQETQMVTVTYVDTSNWKEFKDSTTGEVLYLYPTDWTAEQTANGVVIFTSPNESWVSEATRKDMNVQQTIDAVKKEVVEDGFTFESEVLLDDKDPGAGSLLTFYSEAGAVYVYVLRQDGTEEALGVIEGIQDGYFEVDDPIIMKIIFG